MITGRDNGEDISCCPGAAETKLPQPQYQGQQAGQRHEAPGAAGRVSRSSREDEYCVRHVFGSGEFCLESLKLIANLKNLKSLGKGLCKTVQKSTFPPRIDSRQSHKRPSSRG